MILSIIGLHSCMVDTGTRESHEMLLSLQNQMPRYSEFIRKDSAWKVFSGEESFPEMKIDPNLDTLQIFRVWITQPKGQSMLMIKMVRQNFKTWIINKIFLQGGREILAVPNDSSKNYQMDSLKINKYDFLDVQKIFNSFQANDFRIEDFNIETPTEGYKYADVYHIETEALTYAKGKGKVLWKIKQKQEFSPKYASFIEKVYTLSKIKIDYFNKKSLEKKLFNKDIK